ncbi:MAG: DUF4339 domain-containing protein [Pirellulales bacterium]|nr:DUF4339 domain-containing protein [Pirellulales bacterium]
MANPPGDRPRPDDESFELWPDEGSQADSPTGEAGYGVSEPDSQPTGQKTATTESPWYAATGSNQQVGPLTLGEVKRQIAAGQLTDDDLVWRAGMASWAPAKTVPELSVSEGMPPAPPPVPKEPAAAAPADSTAGVTEFLQQIDAVFSNPLVFRVTGRVCAALSLLVFMMSLILWRWGGTWFTGAVFFGLIFFIGEAAGAILAALGRVEPHSKHASTRRMRDP